VQVHAGGPLPGGQPRREGEAGGLSSWPRKEHQDDCFLSYIHIDSAHAVRLNIFMYFITLFDVFLNRPVRCQGKGFILTIFFGKNISSCCSELFYFFTNFLQARLTIILNTALINSVGLDHRIVPWDTVRYKIISKEYSKVQNDINWDTIRNKTISTWIH
jgi:hypothetical protein